jgi:hypothetical protein
MAMLLSYPQSATRAPRFCPSGRPAPPRGCWAKISPLFTPPWITPHGSHPSFRAVDFINIFSYPGLHVSKGERPMKMPDEFSQSYQAYLTGTYDCVDRIVLNAYFILAQSAGGFRTWWRQLNGSDDDLDNTHLMRFAGRFSRRIHAYAKKQGIPLVHCQRGERKYELAEEHIPKDPAFRGVFCILAALAPMPVFQVHRSNKGITNIQTKTSYVTHYSFHIMDPEWGHLTIKLCPHPPFNAQVILNGHEYVARQAQKSKVCFTKEGNCFTEVADAAGLARIADTMRASSSVGRLVRACERWIYMCLCFALDILEQKKSGFIYSYSVYQGEYSRNLLFTRGRYLDQVFHGVIDRTRAPLNLKMVKTIFGSKHRPLFQWKKRRTFPRNEVVVERPVYDLTIFKIHFGKLTIKMYSKGEHVLRIEVIVHNTKQLHCRKRIDHFPQIIALLKGILEQFLKVLRGMDASFIDNGRLDTWPLASKVGQTRVGGLDVNRPRMRAVMEGVIGLSVNPRGFTASELAGRVKEIVGNSVPDYQARQASYDLKKLRGKDLVQRIKHSRFYEASPEGLRAMAGFVVLREKVLNPLLAGACNLKPGRKPSNRSQIDIHYENIQSEMQNIFEIIGIVA